MGLALDRFEEALRTHGSRGGRGEWTCPAHEDRNPSLSVSNGDGRVLVKCHAGCTTEQVVAALGLTVSDLFDEQPAQKTARRVEVDRYVYENEDGHPVFRVIRYDDKTFRQQRYDAGSWEWGIKGVRRVLFRLPQVLTAIREGRRVYLVEGEKDVRAIERAGAVATCNPMGAGKWEPTYTQALAGAHVFIIADRDDPGVAHAQHVAAELHGHAASIRVLQAATGKDAHDHLAAGHTLDELVPLTAPEEKPEDEPDRRLPVIQSAREVCAIETGTNPDVLGALLVEGARLVVGGHTGHGKTTVVMQMVKAISTAGDFLGYQGSGGRVLVIDLEQGLRTIQRRLTESGLDDSDQVDVLRVPDGLTLDSDQQERAHIEGILQAGNYAAVVIDPLYKLHGGDSNDERAMVDLMRVLDSWRADYGFGLVIPMHLRKPPPQGAKLTMHDVFGSSGVLRGAEVVLGIERLRDGYSHLHYWKDRDGDLPIGSKWGLIFTRENGYIRDPKDGEKKESTVDKVRQLLVEEPGITIDHLVQFTGAARRTVDRSLKTLGAVSSSTGIGSEKAWTLPEVGQGDGHEMDTYAEEDFGF